MRNKELNQFTAATMLLMFLFTSCPAPVSDNTVPVKEPVKQELKYVALEENGQPTDNKDTKTKLYWVEADGVIQPGRISITCKERNWCKRR